MSILNFLKSLDNNNNIKLKYQSHIPTITRLMRRLSIVCAPSRYHAKRQSWDQKLFGSDLAILPFLNHRRKAEIGFLTRPSSPWILGTNWRGGLQATHFGLDGHPVDLVGAEYGSNFKGAWGSKPRASVSSSGMEGTTVNVGVNIAVQKCENARP